MNTCFFSTAFTQEELKKLDDFAKQYNLDITKVNEDED